MANTCVTRYIFLGPNLELRKLYNLLKKVDENVKKRKSSVICVVLCNWKPKRGTRLCAVISKTGTQRDESRDCNCMGTVSSDC